MSKSADRYNGDSLISLQKRLVSAAFILLLFFLCLAQALTEEDPKARAEVQKVIEYPGDSGMTEELYPLRIMLEQLLYGQEGTWSIYIKDLETDEELSMNHQEMYAASLIKLFVMEKTYEDYDTVLENDMEYTGDLSQSQKKIVDLLTDMIQISDNEAFNELVRLQNKERSFSEGCEELNDWLETEGYEDTGIYHTLEPSPSEEEEISEKKIIRPPGTADIFWRRFTAERQYHRPHLRICSCFCWDRNATPRSLPGCRSIYPWLTRPERQTAASMTRRSCSESRATISCV